jgi:hypothetical protein
MHGWDIVPSCWANRHLPPHLPFICFILEQRSEFSVVHFHLPEIEALQVIIASANQARTCDLQSSLDHWLHRDSQVIMVSWDAPYRTDHHALGRFGANKGEGYLKVIKAYET